MKIYFMLLVLILHGYPSEGFSIENEHMLEEFISLLNDLIDILNELILLMEPPNGQTNQIAVNSTAISIVLLSTAEASSVSQDHFQQTTSNQEPITSKVQANETTSISLTKTSPKTGIDTDSSEETDIDTTKVSATTNKPNQPDNILSMTQVTQPIMTTREAKTDDSQTYGTVQARPTQSEASTTAESTTSQPTGSSPKTPPSLIGKETTESSTEFNQTDVPLTINDETSTISTVIPTESITPSETYDMTTRFYTDSSEETDIDTTKVSATTNKPNQPDNISSMTQVTQPIMTTREAKTDDSQTYGTVQARPTQSEASTTAESTTSQPTGSSPKTPPSLIGKETTESSTEFNQTDVPLTINDETSTISTVIPTESITPSETYDTTTKTTQTSTTQTTTEGTTDQPITPHYTQAEDYQTKHQTTTQGITSSLATTTNQAITPHTHPEIVTTGTPGTEFTSTQRTTLVPKSTTSLFTTTDSPDLGGRRKRNIESTSSVNDMLSDLKMILEENDISNTTIEYLRTKVNDLYEILLEYKDDPAASLKMKNDGWTSVTVRDIWKEATAMQKNLRKIKAMISKTLLNLDNHKFLLMFVLLIVLGVTFILMLICLLAMNRKIFIISHLMRSAGQAGDSLPQSSNQKNSRNLPSNYESEEFPRRPGYTDLPICNAIESEGYSSYHLRHPNTFEHWMQPQEENRPSREYEDQPYGEAFNNYNNRGRRNWKPNNGNSFEYKGPEEPLTDYSPPRKGILRRFDPITLNPLIENSKF